MLLLILVVLILGVLIVAQTSSTVSLFLPKVDVPCPAIYASIISTNSTTTVYSFRCSVTTADDWLPGTTSTGPPLISVSSGACSMLDSARVTVDSTMLRLHAFRKIIFDQSSGTFPAWYSSIRKCNLPPVTVVQHLVSRFQMNRVIRAASASCNFKSNSASCAGGTELLIRNRSMVYGSRSFNSHYWATTGIVVPVTVTGGIKKIPVPTSTHTTTSTSSAHAAKFTQKSSLCRSRSLLVSWRCYKWSNDA